METRYSVKRIGLISAMQMGFATFFIFGLFAGLLWGSLFSVFSSVISAFLRLPFSGVGAFSIVLFPVAGAFFWGLFGGVVIMFTALCYNIAAGIFGGFEVEIERSEQKNNNKDEYKDIYGVI